MTNMTANACMVGLRIRGIRQKRHLTQAEFAKCISVVSPDVCKWERGYCLPCSESVIRICNTFDVSADWLLGITRADWLLGDKQKG